MVRDFKAAAKKLLDCMSTFNCPEVVSFEKIIFYAVLTSMMTLERSDIKKHVLKNSEVLSCIKDDKSLDSFLNSYYMCDYSLFFKTLLDIVKSVEGDRLLGTHRKFV